jgi:hypothetical protein
VDMKLADLLSQTPKVNELIASTVRVGPEGQRAFISTPGL